MATPLLNSVNVRELAAELSGRMDRCDHGEGLECANLDETLRLYARICCEFREAARQWAREVFAGRTEFSPEIEGAWLDEGRELYRRALNLWESGKMAEEPCFSLSALNSLQSALWGLQTLIRDWVSPARAVGPSARLVLAPAVIAEAKKRLSELEPLPADWEPTDPRLQARWKLRSGRS